MEKIPFWQFLRAISGAHYLSAEATPVVELAYYNVCYYYDHPRHK
jgi:hypothetical protein